MVAAFTVKQSVISTRLILRSARLASELRLARNSRLLKACDRHQFIISSRCMSSEEGENGKKEDGKPETKSGKRMGIAKEGEAKSKLNDLLLSISKDASDRKSKELPNEPSKIFSARLAVPKKEKVDRKKPSDKITPKGSGEVRLGKRVLAAVKKVAAELDGDAEQIESELVKKLKSQTAAKVKINDLFEGMKIESAKEQPDRQMSASRPATELKDIETSRAARVRKAVGQKPTRRFQQYTRDKPDTGDDGRQRSQRSREGPVYMKVDLFGARPLGIFSGPAADPTASQQSPPELKTWDRIQKKELKLIATHPPANGFEEMILWTEQEKLWKFPINNEQGMEEEAQYSFEDHVFLENYIESWCPDEGPVRIFMELVCVGLSKNSYLTVPEKREYLDWYHEYFKKKSGILKEVGAAELKS